MVNQKKSKSRVACKENQVRNSQTGRCRLKKSVKKASKSMRKKSVRKASKSMRKPCNANQVRDRMTKRCRLKKSAKKKTKSSSMHSRMHHMSDDSDSE